MKNKALQARLSDEISEFLQQQKSLLLASKTEQDEPYASYSPYALGDECLYILISDIAVHAQNLAKNPNASILVIEDEATAERIYARVRLNYTVNAKELAFDSADWQQGIQALQSRHGDIVENLSQLSDFHLFKLAPQGGRYVKGFGKAYSLAAGSLAQEVNSHLTDGHTPRSQAMAS